jgi:hypothetical protein
LGMPNSGRQAGFVGRPVNNHRQTSCCNACPCCKAKSRGLGLATAAAAGALLLA